MPEELGSPCLGLYRPLQREIRDFRPQLACSSHERDFRDNLVPGYLQDSLSPVRLNFDLTTSFGSSAAKKAVVLPKVCFVFCTHVLNIHVVHPKRLMMLLQHAHANP